MLNRVKNKSTEKIYLFKSARLGFRNWQKEDLIPFIKMNSDVELMKYFPKILSPEETKIFFKRIGAHFNENSFGLWAVDKLETNDFIGFIGFMIPGFEAYFTPCVEIGWRLKREEWNQGLASEGANRCLYFGFEKYGFSTVYSFTSISNQASERVMQKIGMEKDGEFDHPYLENGHQLSRHVIYKISADKS